MSAWLFISSVGSDRVLGVHVQLSVTQQKEAHRYARMPSQTVTCGLLLLLLLLTLAHELLVLDAGHPEVGRRVEVAELY